MNNELQEKLSKLIEANFPKMESEVLVRLVSEHTTLTNDITKTQKKLEEVKLENSKLEDKLDKAEEDLKYKCSQVKKLEEDLSKKTEEFNAIKKDITEIEIKCLRESNAKIFNLVETVFRNPSKIEKFNTPVRKEHWETQYDARDNDYKEVRRTDQIEDYQIVKVTTEE